MKRVAWLLLGAVLVAGCGVPVAVESDPTQRRPGWKTWSWLSRPPVAQGDTTYAAIDQRVHAPRVIDHGVDGDAQWLLTDAVPGGSAVGDRWRARRSEAITPESGLGSELDSAWAMACSTRFRARGGTGDLAPTAIAPP